MATDDRIKVIDTLMDEVSAKTSSEMMGGLRKRVENAIEEMNADLSKYAEMVCFIPRDKREKLKKFIVNIDLIKGFSNTTLNVKDGCISILELEDRRTKPHSRASYSEIENAAKIVLNGGKTDISSTVRYDVLKKAVNDGIESAVRDELKKINYLEEVVGSHSEEFLKDVYRMVTYQERPGALTGRCWKVICSNEYIEEIEKQIFGSRAVDFFKYCDMKYDSVIQKGLEAKKKEEEEKKQSSLGEKIDQGIDIATGSALKAASLLFPNLPLRFGMILTDSSLHPLGFVHDEEQDIYYSDVYAWQWFAGFNDSYDAIFDLFCDMKCKKFIFTQDLGGNSMRYWRLELWRGNYPNVYSKNSVGAEIGIYYADVQKSELENYTGDPTPFHFYSATADDLLLMSFALLDENDTVIFERAPTEHWWLTGFKPNLEIQASKLIMVGSITFKSQEMFDAFMTSLDRQNGDSSTWSLQNNDWSFEITGLEGLTIFFKWK